MREKGIVTGVSSLGERLWLCRDQDEVGVIPSGYLEFLNPWVPLYPPPPVPPSIKVA